MNCQVQEHSPFLTHLEKPHHAFSGCVHCLHFILKGNQIFFGANLLPHRSTINALQKTFFFILERSRKNDRQILK